MFNPPNPKTEHLFLVGLTPGLLSILVALGIWKYIELLSMVPELIFPIILFTFIASFAISNVILGILFKKEILK